MYDYKFIKINVGAFSGKPKEDYEEIIIQQAQEGWRLHTFTPLPFASGGQALEIQLIFERELK
ncbi:MULTISPECIES: DUF4177 domain-containing protein [unclassified Cytobacillus]|jgi:Domain of unknown function (DUF4177)|uniref:DUF4177 domain-containing protein n=1 Tax=unclassified Cytobacillus TaxID=2675268 RepID=UPI001356CBBB|nr:DUF4177 domain-containing protein [Cytobacillus sp. AMY 15.2]KAF0821041.1 hypothetical protein KIS4809_0568 [Bacillus sp. ZZV12-4809]MCM3090995.1 DUF4177 domain-containing protein [Cytobacillus sp. AMY 15.2]